MASVMVHVSTCYAFTNYPYVEEQTYPPLADWRETLQICDVIDKHTLSSLTNMYIGGMPNTYVFTKQLAEQLVYELKGQLPIIIIRPSVVIGSLKDPFPGWTNNFNGPNGIINGTMRSLCMDTDIVVDFIPVDTSIKHFITAGWIRGTKKLEPTDEVEIYNCCSTGFLKLTVGEVCETGKIVSYKYPTTLMLWYPGFTVTTSRTYHYLKVMLVQVLPMIFADLLLWLLGKKPMLVKIQRRIFQDNIAIRYYTTREWIFDNKNFINLLSRIKEQDKEQFSYAIPSIDTLTLFVESARGGRRCLLKESDEDLPKARARLVWMYALHVAVKIISFGYLFWWIWNSSYLQNLFN